MVFLVCVQYGVQSSHGALAVSRKYFKQSKWPLLGRILTRPFAILIILTLNKIFEYVEMTILQPPKRQYQNPKALSLLRVSI